MTVALTDEQRAVLEAELAAEPNGNGLPPRGSLKAKQWVEGQLLWRELGVTLERVVVDGHEADSTVWLYTNTKRTIALSVADLFSRTRFQATMSAALTYGAPLFKADKLKDIAGAILGLASVEVAYSSLQEAQSWGIAYVSTVERLPYDDSDNAGAAERRYAALRALRDDGALARAQKEPPPGKALERGSDSGLLIVRSWFHHAVHSYFAAGDRGLSAQRIGSLMLQTGWKRPAATHWKVAAREPGENGGMATLAVYVVPADWEPGVLDEAL